jgi:hypothetical protein
MNWLKLAFASFVILAASIAIGIRFQPIAQAKAAAADEDRERWEYLVIAGGTTNLAAATDASMRKETSGAFGREAYPLEKNLDRLGNQGWELVGVSGNPNDPTYYLKRRK